LCLYSAFSGLPNWSVKRTPTRAMPSAFSWPLLVPFAPSVLRRRLPWALGLMKSSSGEPSVEVLEALETDRGFRLVCRFDEPYQDPVAPGALYDEPGSAEAQFFVHKLVEQNGLIYTFETFERGLKPPSVGRQFYYRGWWVRAAMRAALDVS